MLNVSGAITACSASAKAHQKSSALSFPAKSVAPYAENTLRSKMKQPMNLSLIRCTAGTLLFAASVGSAVAQQACADLMHLELPYTTIASAAVATEGPLPQPAIFGNTDPIMAP